MTKQELELIRGYISKAQDLCEDLLVSLERSAAPDDTVFDYACKLDTLVCELDDAVYDALVRDTENA